MLTADRDMTYEVTDRVELDSWARAHWLTVQPWAERARTDRGAPFLVRMSILTTYDTI